MKKIVINNSFGTYSLSPQAVKRYAELAGIELYPFTWDFTDLGAEAVIPMTWDEALAKKKSLMDVRTYSTKPIVGNHINEDDYWRKDINRDDPVLVQVVEELGTEAAGSCASLKVVEIPDDVDWQLCEYDGLEWIAEKHRTWK